jgi:GTP-binding protein HflX
MTRTSSDKLIILERPPITERAILACLALPQNSDEDVEESLAELKQLAWTAGADPVLTVIQRRDTPHPGTHLGSGKVEEIKNAVAELEADVVIFDSELSPRQGSKLEDLLECKVVDRTQLILDIFAQRAQTREGKHQVELAQLQYMLPRLAGRGSVMRQTGGIGVRGPGEQKLESDRRIIREKITRLKADLEVIRSQRRVQRHKRTGQALPQVALVGYTNAGKSSLLNALTKAHVLAEDKLFATLDPKVRQYVLPSGRPIVVADTVGFIRNLPHNLVAAFRATMEEVNESTLLLHVIDAAHPAMADHMAAVNLVLDEIKAAEIPVIKVYNKMDQLTPEHAENLRADRDPAVVISAQTGEGIDTLLDAIEQRLGTHDQRVHLRIPPSESALAARVHAEGRVREKSYDGDMMLLEVDFDENAPLLGVLAPYRVKTS